jgi:hypothetical protein
LRRALFVLLALGACAQPAAGATYRYAEGAGSLRLAAGAEHNEYTASDVIGSYTRNRTFAVKMSAPATLDALVRNPRGRALYHASQLRVVLAVGGRRLTLDDGGVCTLQLLRAERDGAEGSVTCVGLGTHSGKGYDINAMFTLSR